MLFSIPKRISNITSVGQLANVDTNIQIAISFCSSGLILLPRQCRLGKNMVNHLRNVMESGNALISAAYGANQDYVENLLGSFREVNQKDAILLLVTDKKRLASIADRYNATLVMPPSPARFVPSIRVKLAKNPVRLLELVSRSSRLGVSLACRMPSGIIEAFLPLPMARVFHTIRVLEKCTFSHVLLSDARDVVFQADPFTQPTDLEFALEDNCFGSSRFNDCWFQQSFGIDAWNQIIGKRAFCSGTIFGRTKAVLGHLRNMAMVIRDMISWKSGGQDQAAHNYVIHKILSPDDYSVSTNLQGRIATLGQSRSATIENGFVIDQNGKRFPVVHQYDRLPEYEQKRILALRGSSAV
jgi:hypothetical protein